MERKNPFQKKKLVYSVSNLQLENLVMSNAHQFCHNSGFACMKGSSFHQGSGDVKQLFGNEGPRSRGKGQSIGYCSGCGSALPQTFGLASGGTLKKCS